MKTNKSIIIICIVLSVLSKSQNQTIDLINRCVNPDSYSLSGGNAYLKDVSNIMNPYIGTWKWTSGNREMILTLIKQNKYHISDLSFNFYKDRLVGYYVYKENGTIISDTSTDNLMQDYGLNVEFDVSCNNINPSSIFKDTFRGITYIVSLEMLSPTQMKFKGRMWEGTYPRPRNGTKYYMSGTTFPLNMVFTKQ